MGNWFNAIIVAAACATGLAPADTLWAQESAFQGALSEPVLQAPSSRFSNAMSGDVFAALFSNGATAADAQQTSCDSLLEECEWVFSASTNPLYGASLDGSGSQATASTISIFVQNNRPLPADEAEFFGSLIGEVFEPGTQVDAWLAEAVEDDAFFINEDDDEVLANGVRWQIIYLTRDTNLYEEPSRSPISYRAEPPSLSAVELAFLLIEEADSQGNVTFFATALLIEPEPPGPLFSSLLPTARAVQVGNAASAFTTIVNAAGEDLSGCGITPITSVPASFRYQTTDSANSLVGTANTPAPIAAGAFQTYALFLTPLAEIAPTEIEFDYSCSPSGAAAETVSGVNTLRLFASANPIPDIVALAASTTPGQLVLDTAFGAGAFTVATVNLGSSDVLTVSATSSTSALLSWCRTDPETSLCVEPASPTFTPLDIAIGAGETPTFGVFASSDGGPIPFDPSANRVYFRLRDAGGNVVGETSVAISGP